MTGGRADGPTDSLRARSVAEVVDTLRRAIESSMGQVWVKGEIGELKVNQSGHWFFTLRDADASIKCIMWATYARRARITPAPGTEVYMLARPDFWAERGELRMTAVTVLPTAGVGDAQLELQRVREALAKDGLFDPSRKRALPQFPRRVAIVTSLDGAALHDMVTVARKRWPARIVVVKSAVQGESAEGALVHALTLVNLLKADVCVVGRGGGSKDDLSAFNLEAVCRAIAAVMVPVVTAVGHQTDFTLADLVADARAATPSAAMELVLPDRADVLHRLGAVGSRLGRALQRRTRLARERLYRTEDRLQRGIRDALAERHRSLDRAAAKLDALSPLKVLARGYAVPRAEDGHVLRRKSEFTPGRRFMLTVSDGEAAARVE